MKSSEYKENKFFNAVLWIGALEMMQAVAQARKEDALLKEITALLALARTSTEQQFWNAQYGFFQYNQHNDDLMGDAMVGQRYIDVTGLPPVLTPDRMASHYRQIFKRGVLALKDCNGDGIGDVGVSECCSSGFSSWCWRQRVCPSIRSLDRCVLLRRRKHVPLRQSAGRWSMQAQCTAHCVGRLLSNVAERLHRLLVPARPKLGALTIQPIFEL